MRPSNGATRAAADDGDPEGAGDVRLMITGDSMTQGQEGDYTWRYRLWEWLQSSRPAQPRVRFVGPFQGTMEPEDPLPPQPPRFKWEPDLSPGYRVKGKYSADCNSQWQRDSFHFSLWGRQAAQVQPEIEEQVAEHKPDYLLVALGFNDLGWFVSDAAGLLQNMELLVFNARRGKPDIKLVLSTVPSRSFMEGRQDLVDNTSSYNSKIKEAAMSWTTIESPIVLADFESNYSCRPDGCPAGYDGLHPNLRGEFEIARAFSHALVEFGLCQDALELPVDMHEPIPPAPQNVSAVSSPMGVAFTWSPVFGSRAYEIRTRVHGTHQWDGPHGLQTPRHDITFTAAGVTWEAQVRSLRGTTEETKSAWSPIVSAISTRTAAPPPRSIRVTPLDGGVQVAWLPPDGDWNIDRYEVILLDMDIPGAFITGHAASSGLFIHGGLERGHRFKVWVATWAFIKGELARGVPGEASPFLPDFGAPQAPGNVEHRATQDSAFSLHWQRSEGAASYVVYSRNSRLESVFKEYKSVVGATHLDLKDGATGEIGSVEYAITARNGDLESERSTIVA